MELAAILSSASGGSDCYTAACATGPRWMQGFSYSWRWVPRRRAWRRRGAVWPVGVDRPSPWGGGGVIQDVNDLCGSTKAPVGVARAGASWVCQIAGRAKSIAWMWGGHELERVFGVFRLCYAPVEQCALRQI